jgi:ribonuclease HI
LVAQTCELYALNQALKHLKDKEETIYTDSKYEFGVVHTFGKIWMEQGIINNKGQDLVYGELIQQILESLKLPEEIAIVHVPGYQKWVNFEAPGNSFADETAKKAALTSEAPVFCLIPYLPAPHVTAIFTHSEEQQLKNLGAVRIEQGKWVLPDGREMISKLLMRKLLTYLTRGASGDPQAMCDMILQVYR